MDDDKEVTRYDYGLSDYITVNWDSLTINQDIINSVIETTAKDPAIVDLENDLRNFKAEVNERLAHIEEQMAILRPDEILGEEFDELKEAFEAYNKLMEKLRTFKALKDSA